MANVKTAYAEDIAEDFFTTIKQTLTNVGNMTKQKYLA